MISFPGGTFVFQKDSVRNQLWRIQDQIHLISFVLTATCLGSASPAVLRLPDGGSTSSLASSAARSQFLRGREDGRFSGQQRKRKESYKNIMFTPICFTLPRMFLPFQKVMLFTTVEMYFHVCSAYTSNDPVALPDGA